MMVGVVNDDIGTGSGAQIPGVQVAGKTGTAEDDPRSPTLWFTCVRPGRRPAGRRRRRLENGGDPADESTGGAARHARSRGSHAGGDRDNETGRGSAAGRALPHSSGASPSAAWARSGSRTTASWRARSPSRCSVRSTRATRTSFERLRTEARNSSSLSTPTSPQMYDYGEQRGVGYLVMELVLGEPLADLLEREPVLRRPGCCRSWRRPRAPCTPRTSPASSTATSNRATSCSSLVGTVKITDFGVSLAPNQVPMTATGMVMGTAQYLSPEQAVGQAGDGRLRHVRARDRRLRVPPPGVGRSPADAGRHRGRARQRAGPAAAAPVHPALSALITRCSRRTRRSALRRGARAAPRRPRGRASPRTRSAAPARAPDASRRPAPSSPQQRSSTSRPPAAARSVARAPADAVGGGRHTRSPTRSPRRRSGRRRRRRCRLGHPGRWSGSGPYGSGAYGSDSRRLRHDVGRLGTDAYAAAISPPPRPPAGAPGPGRTARAPPDTARTPPVGTVRDSAGYGAASGAYGTDAQGRPHGSG